jgi:hypothetical protein
MSTAAIAKCWTFGSSSGRGTYQTLLYSDGSTSCDCPGWCRRVAADGSRSCKHTRAVLMGTADRECQSMHNPRSPAAAVPVLATTLAERAITPFGQLGRRKIQT